MYQKWTTIVLKFIIIFGLCINSAAQNQPEKPENKTNRVKKDSLKTVPSQKFILDQIEVRGWVEKPQTVFVVPGVNPEIDDIVLDRSFISEILTPLDKDKFERQQALRQKTIIPW